MITAHAFDDFAFPDFLTIGNMMVISAPVLNGPRLFLRLAAVMLPPKVSIILREIESPKPECWPKDSPSGRSV